MFAATLAPLSARAVLVHQYTFNNGTAQDSVGTAHGTLNGATSISVQGIVNFPGNTGDYISLPGASINLAGMVDATFESWFSWQGTGPWQRVFDFGAISGTSGTDYVFYTPNGSGAFNRAALRDGTSAENIANDPAAVTQNTLHQVAVVVDDNANGGTDRLSLYLDGVFRADTAFTYALSQLSNANAFLGRSLYSGDAYLNGTMDEFRIYNNALTAAQVAASFAAGPVPVNLLELQVNTFNGEVTIKNSFTSPLSIDYYKVTSTKGALNPANAPVGWNSLDDQNIDAVGTDTGQSWDEEGSPTNNDVAELFLNGASTIAANGTRSLGKLFNPSVDGKRHTSDLKFQFATQGGNLLTGNVTYIIPPPLVGDYNDDGFVNAADYTVYRNHANTVYQLTNEAAGVTPGSVTIADYTQWKMHYGESLNLGSGAEAVPEPASCWLLVLGMLAVFSSVQLRRQS